jgi:excisionase family DNA binding protein
MAARKPKPMMTIEKPEGMIRSTEAARRLGVTKPTILAWYEAGRIRGWRNVINRWVWIEETEVARIVREGYERDEK